jgi:hypothetical protein
MNVPAWRAWVNRYLAGDLPDGAVEFRASATGWALHKQAGVEIDITRLRGDPLKVHLSCPPPCGRQCFVAVGLLPRHRAGNGRE